jgi:hypothetical protein
MWALILSVVATAGLSATCSAAADLKSVDTRAAEPNP